MKNVLITGGAGFIGSNFIRFMLTHRPALKITNLDALTYAGNLKNLDGIQEKKSHTFIQGNICDRKFVERIIKEHEIDTIVNFAAETHVDRSIKDPAPFIKTNIMGVYTLLEAARSCWMDDIDNKLFHQISTDEVYGSLSPADPPFSETDPYKPSSPYSASKASADHLVRSYSRTFNLPTTISICSNNYGPYQHTEKLIPMTIQKCFRRERIPIYGDGLQIRDWIYVADHCKAVLSIIESGIKNETFNIGGNSEVPNIRMVNVICSLIDDLTGITAGTKSADLITFVDDRPGHDRRYAINNAKINQAVDWSPAENLQSGLEKTVKWYYEKFKMDGII